MKNLIISCLAAFLLPSALHAQITGSGSIFTNPVSPITNPVWNTGNMLVGESGTGELTISTGGTVNTANSGAIGNNAVGTVTVNGGSWLGANQLIVGYANGTGTLNFSSGTISNATGFVGGLAGGIGIANVSGGNWTNSNELILGYDAPGTVNLSGGTISSAAARFAANSASSSGTLNLNGGVFATGHVFEVVGNGTVTFNGGTLRLTGNRADLFSGFEVGDVSLSSGGGTIDTQAFTVATSLGLTGTGSLTKTGSGTLTLTGNNTYTGRTTIRNGTLTVSGGGAINHSSADLTIGSDPGDNATFTLSNGTVSNAFAYVGLPGGSTGVANVTGGNWTNSGILIVGFTGNGSLTLSNGTISNTDGVIGNNPGATGVANVTGGNWTNSGSVTLGQNSGATGTLNLNGGTVTASQVQEGSGNGTVTFNGGTLRLTGNQSDLFNGFDAGDVTLVGPGGGTIDTQSFSVTTGYALTGNGSLTKRGTGTLTLTGNNTYSGGTTITAGTLAALVNATQSGISTGAASIASNSTLQINKDSTAGTLNIANTITGTGTLNLNFATGGSGNTLIPNATAFNGTIRLTTAGATGDKLAANTAFAAALEINTGTTLYVQPNAAFARGISVNGAGNNEGFGAIRLDFGATLGGNVSLLGNSTIGGANGGGTLFGNVSSGVAGPVTLTAGAGNGDLDFLGAITNGAGTLALTKQGTGTLTLSGNNTYSGGTTLANGTLRLLNNNAVGTGNITTTGSVISYGNDITINNPIVLNSNTTQLEVLGTDSATQAGVISETGGARPLEKIGNGTLTLTGNNTYTGATTVTAGTLAVSGGGSINHTSATMTVGSSSGDNATLTIGPNGTVSNADGFIGNDVGSTGTVALSGGNWTNSGGLYVGNSGNGRLTITNGTVSNTFGSIATSANSISTVTLNGGNWTNSSALFVGNAGNGSLTITNGTVSNTDGYVGTSANSTGRATLNGGNWINSGSLFVGSFGNGSLTITNGTVSNSIGYIGNDAVSTGTATLNGGNWTNSDVLYVGLSGNGSLTINDGTVSNTTGSIGFNSGSTGLVTVNGGNWINSSSLTLGQSANATGTLNLNGGVVTAAQVSEGLGNGTVTFNGGTVRLTGNQADLFTGFEAGDVRLLGPGGGIIDTQAFTVATALGLTGNGSLTKQGNGSLTLTGNNTYAGGTTVRNGTLAVSGGGAINHSASNLNVGLNSGDNATFTLSNGTVNSSTTNIGQSAGSTGTANVTGGTWTNVAQLIVGNGGNGTLNLSNGTVSSSGISIASSAGSTSNIKVTGGDLTSTSVLNIGTFGSGSLDLSNGTVTNTSGTAGLASGSNGMVTVSGGNWTNSGDLTLGTFGTGTLNLSNGTVSNVLGNLGSMPDSAGTANVSGGTWTNSQSLYIGEFGTGTLNLSNGSVSSSAGYLGREVGSTGVANVTGGTWTNSAILTIGQSGTGTLNVSNGTVSAAAIVVGASAAGTGSVQLTGGVLSTGQVSEGLGNGTVTFNGGTLRLTGNQTDLFTGFETGDVTLVGSGGTIDTDGFAVDSAYALSGNGSLTKSGNGSLTLTGNNTYSGNTTVAAGSLAVLGRLANGTVTVEDTATLSGNGTIAGDVVVQNGGRIAAGTSPGTLTVGSLTLNATSILDYELDTPGIVGGGVNDLIQVNGNLVLDGTLNIIGLTGFGAGNYTLMTYNGTLTNNGLTFGIQPGGYDLTLDTATANQVNLTSALATSQFWDGPNTSPNNAVDGGTGTWNGSNTNWTNSNGNVNSAWLGTLRAVFEGTAGTVTVDDGYTATAPGFDFRVGGYTVAATGTGALSLNGTTDFNTVTGITTVSAPITGNSSLTKQGNGTLTLTGNNSYAGGTTVRNGNLTVSDGGSIKHDAADLIVGQSSGDNAFLTISANSSVSNALGRLGNSANATGTVNVSGGNWTNASDLFIGVLGNGTMNLSNGTVSNEAGYVGLNSGTTGTVNVTGGTWTNTGALNIGEYGNGTMNLSNGTVSNSQGFVGRYANATGTVNVTGGNWTNSSVLFVGFSGNGTLNLSDGTVSTASATLGLIADGTGSVHLLGGLFSTSQISEGDGEGSVTFNGGTLLLSGDQTDLFSGFESGDVSLVGLGGTINTQAFNVATRLGLTGNGSLTKLGSGNLTLSGNSSYTGNTTVSAGTLQLGNGGTSGSLAGNVALSGGTNLIFNRSNTSIYGGNITGGGSVLHNGSGKTVLTGTSNYSGGTAINAGTLEVSGAGNVSGASLFMRNGTYNVIGNGTASHNNLFVSDTAGTTSIVNVNTGGNLTASGPIFIGHTGTGTMNVSGNGSRVTGSSTTFIGGPVAGGRGTLNVTDNATFSTSSNLFVGNNGRGLLNIASGGNVTSGVISVGTSSGSEGIITLDAGTLTGTSISVGQSGTGNLTALNGSTVNASSGSTFIGSSGEGTARFNASTFNAGQLFIANTANGSLTIENGSTLNTSSANAFIAAGSGTTGILTVSGNGSTWLNKGQVFIGNNGNGTLNVLDGAVVTSGGGNAFVGAGSASTGALFVDGIGSNYTVSGTGDFSVGGIDSSVVVSNSGLLETKGRAFIAAGAGTSASALVAGAGSRWRSLDYFSVGQQGTASLTVADRGVVQAGASGNGTIYIGDQTNPGRLNIGAGAGAGLIEASTITGGFAGTNPATVSFNHTDTAYFFTNTGDSTGTAIAITGNTQVGFFGSGTTVLTSANTYTGGTAISQSTVRTTNAAALGTGEVIMKSGTLDPVGRLEITSLTWGGGTIATELGTATDLLALSGNLSLSGGGNFTFTAGTGFAPNTSYTILSAANLSDSMLALFGGNSLLGSAPTFLRDGLNLLVRFIVNSGGGTIIQNSAPISTPDNANFLVTGAARTGSPTENNTIRSLTFNPDTSLLIFNTLQITSGNVTVPTGNATITGGLLNAPGGFNKNGSGFLSILANILANGRSAVNAGSLFINGIFQANGGLTVFQNALLGGNGTIFGNVFNFGTVAPGNSPGTLTIAGDFTQSASGTLALEIASPTVFDRLVVSGTANLGGTLAVQNLGTSLAYGQQYAFLEAGSTSGAFDQITMPQSDLYRGRLLINGGTGTLLVAPTSYTLVAETQNQRNVAKALDSFIPATSGDRLAVSTALDLQSASQYPAAFDAISPAQYENLTSTSIEQSNALSQILQQRFSSVRLTGARGFTQQGLKSPIVSDSGKSYVGKNVREGKDILTPAPDNNWGAWVQGEGFFGDFTSLATVPNSRFTSGGVTAGLDYRFPVGVTVGVFSGYSGLYSKYANGGTMNINTVNFGLYAAYEHDGGFYANVIVAGGYSGYQVKRSVEFSTIDRAAKSDPSGGLFSTTLDLGYDWEVGGFTITPTIAGQFTYVGIAPFTESGADSLDLRVDDQAATSLRTSLGARVAYPIKISESIAFIPQVSLLWQHEFLQNSRNIGAALDGGAGPGFDYATTTPSRDAAYAGAGFTLRVGETVSFNANYNVNFGREDFLSNMVSGGLNISF